MKQRLLYGMCIMILFSLVGCGNESEVQYLDPESVSMIEPSNKSGSIEEGATTSIENSQRKDLSQPVYSATIERQTYVPEEEYMSRSLSDADELYIFLSGLNFSSDICDGLPEYSILFDDGSEFFVNITEGWIWKDKTEARLTSDEIVLLNSLIQ